MSSHKSNKLTPVEHARLGTIPPDRGVYLQHHQPEWTGDPYHFHPTMEINFLSGCDMVYSFAGKEMLLKSNRFCVFWAAVPHRVAAVHGKGLITNAYVNLSEFLRWSLPENMVRELLGGGVLVAKRELLVDEPLTQLWAQEADETSMDWQRLHALEVRSRLQRMALEGWDSLLEPDLEVPKAQTGAAAMKQLDDMLRFIALNYEDRIDLTQVANAGGISKNYAMTIFKRLLGRTVKEYITELRIIHAKMLLVTTNDKILTIALDCGFGSASTFYDVFHIKTGHSPAAFRDEMRKQNQTLTRLGQTIPRKVKEMPYSRSQEKIES